MNAHRHKTRKNDEFPAVEFATTVLRLRRKSAVNNFSTICEFALATVEPRSMLMTPHELARRFCFFASRE